MVTTIQTARGKKFCGPSVVNLKEANCDPQVQDAKASVEQHRVRQDEGCQVCDSSLQEEVKALITNRIIPALEKILCVGCGVIHSCHTAFRTRLRMLIAVAGPAVRCPVRRGGNISCYTTDNDDDKKAWLTQLLGRQGPTAGGVCYRWQWGLLNAEHPAEAHQRAAGGPQTHYSDS